MDDGWDRGWFFFFLFGGSKVYVVVMVLISGLVLCKLLFGLAGSFLLICLFRKRRLIMERAALWCCNNVVS